MAATSSIEGKPPACLRLVENGKVFYPASLQDYELTKVKLRTPTVTVNIDHVGVLRYRAQRLNVQLKSMPFSKLEERALATFEKVANVELTVRSGTKGVSSSSVAMATAKVTKRQVKSVKRALTELRTFYNRNLYDLEVKARRLSGGFKVTLIPVRNLTKVPDWDSKEYEEATLARLAALREEVMTPQERVDACRADVSARLGATKLRYLIFNAKGV